MIKFFFNRFSWAVKLMEALGFILFAISAGRMFMGGSALPMKILFSTAIIEYAFIRYCASVRWYRDAPRWSGIELQFKRALVPTSYILAIFGAAIIAYPSAALAAVVAFLLLVIAHVNVILIYFHLRDGDETPANFYSGGHWTSAIRSDSGAACRTGRSSWRDSVPMSSSSPSSSQAS